MSALDRTDSIPLLGVADGTAPLAYKDGKTMTRGAFLRAVGALSQSLPNARYAINLCHDRYHFMLAFASACLRGQTNLLPASLASGALDDVRGAFPDHYVLDDRFVESCRLASTDSSAEPRIAADHVAAICFTSGSTGAPRAHRNTWSTLVASAERSAAGIFTQRGLNLVATVPPQHMFGLETSILQPLFNDCAVFAGKPFFPADVHAALESVPAPRALITTPTHLRACVAALPSLPTIEFVLSATAPLDADLAAAAERQWRTRVREIYGSTETGAIATRRTAEGNAWTLLPGGSLVASGDALAFQPQRSTQRIDLHDTLHRIDDTRFELRGRSSDLIKVAGKRASLSELNARLIATPGVKDGVIFQPHEDQRVAALAVVDGIDERDILAALSPHFDEVFLPRPIKLVAALPRDALGKLPRERLLAELNRTQSH